MIDLSDDNGLVCDSGLVTIRKFKGEIVKLKEVNLEHGEERTRKDNALTYARQCTECGHNSITGAFC